MLLLGACICLFFLFLLLLGLSVVLRTVVGKTRAGTVDLKCGKPGLLLKVSLLAGTSLLCGLSYIFLPQRCGVRNL